MQKPRAAGFAMILFRKYDENVNKHEILHTHVLVMSKAPQKFGIPTTFYEIILPSPAPVAQ